ncbi:hypothetical protein V8F20_004983 [Naviculisporaceae sp. PSN 640]
MMFNGSKLASLLLLTLSATSTLANPLPAQQKVASSLQALFAADAAKKLNSTLASPLADQRNEPSRFLNLFAANAADKPTPKPEPNHDPKTCTLRLLGAWSIEEDDMNGDDEVWWHTYYVYNDRDEVIGRAANKPDIVREGASLYAALPYTVEIRKLRRGGDYNNIHFCYASGCYKGGFNCRRYYINNAPSFIGFVNDCSREFDCGHA